MTKSTQIRYLLRVAKINLPIRPDTEDTMRDTIRRFRAFNRFYMNLTGVMRRSFLGGRLNLAEARILYEIRSAPEIDAAALSKALNMDKAQISRILKRLVQLGLVDRDDRPSGRKAVPLILTQQGTGYLRDLDREADRQAETLLCGMNSSRRRELDTALDTVQRLFTLNTTPSVPAAPNIREAGSGDLGWIARSHAHLYETQWGFGPTFEHYVLLGLAEYISGADEPGSRIWIAETPSGPTGSIGIVKNSDTEAQLRWFLVTPEAQGRGLGRTLLETALSFCRKHRYETIFLWTFAGLDSARHLYSSSGFVRTDTKPGQLGEVPITEEKWTLRLH